MKYRKITIASLLSVLLAVSCIFSKTVKDIDGNVYKIVKIGNQWWMAENLRITHYRNGDPIPNVTENSEWFSLKTAAYSNYGNNEVNAAIYGRIYNWYAKNDHRKIAPEGWHVPTDHDWKELELFLGMSQEEADDDEERGTNEGGKLKESGTAHWNSPNFGATNESGFTTLAGGFRGDGEDFYGIGNVAVFWSSSASYSQQGAWVRYMRNNNANIYRI